MAIEKVREYMKKFGREKDILEFEVSSATVALAAEALGCEEARIAKTISLDKAGETVLIVAAGDAKIDNHKYKEFFGAKAKMLPFDEVEARVGHAPGGVCPFAVNEDVKIYLDESLKRFDFVYPACGSSNSAIKLGISELMELSGCNEFCDVTKLPE